jgi:hypothetical protein
MRLNGFMPGHRCCKLPDNIVCLLLFVEQVASAQRISDTAYYVIAPRKDGDDYYLLFSPSLQQYY